MPIGFGSRYVNSPVNVVTVKKRSRKVIDRSPQVDYTFDYTTYQWVGSDRIDNLANRFYGDSKQWWAIADGNPEIMDWEDLLPGTIIRVPTISGVL